MSVRRTTLAIVGLLIASRALAQSASGAFFSGRVLMDSTTTPIAGAEVLFPEIGRATMTDDRGNFRIGGIPAGMQHVVVRKVGFSPLDTRLEFVVDETVSRRIYLTRTVTLDSVRVVESASDRLRESFEENRRAGLGKFFTRAELEKQGIARLGQALTQTGGTNVVVGRGIHAWLARSRGVNAKSVKVSFGDRQLGAKDHQCYADVWVDGRRVYAGRDEEALFDLNSLSVDQIDGMEYYSGPATTPAMYTGLDTSCGVLVIWTRRK